MTVFATEKQRYGNLVKYEDSPELNWCTKEVTVREAANTDYLLGMVLGKVTATGKYKISKADAVDGSEVPVAVVLDYFTIAANTDKKMVCMVNGEAILSKAALILDDSWDGSEDVVYSALESLAIQVRDTVV